MILRPVPTDVHISINSSNLSYTPVTDILNVNKHVSVGEEKGLSVYSKERAHT